MTCARPARLFRSGLPAVARRFAGDRRGLAAIEFAFIAPIMVFLFFAVVEGADAFTAARRVSLAANSLADLVAQETQILDADLDGLFTGMEMIMGVDDAEATFSVVSLVYDTDDERVEVAWSYDEAGGAPYAPGAPYTGFPDETLFDEAASLIIAEVDYEYISRLTSFLVDRITMDRRATRWPRRTPQVQYCEAAPGGPICP